MVTCGVYALVDPNTKDIRYIGSSINCEKRFCKHFNKTGSGNPDKLNWIADLKKNDQKPELIILIECSENELAAQENKFIEKYSKTNSLLNKKKAYRNYPKSYEKLYKPVYSKNLLTGEIKYYEKISDVCNDGFETGKVAMVCKQTNNYKIYKGFTFWYKDCSEATCDTWIEFDNLKMPLYLWAKKLNLPFSTLYNRRRKNWTMEKILTTP